MSITSVYGQHPDFMCYPFKFQNRMEGRFYMDIVKERRLWDLDLPSIVIGE